MNKLTTLLLAFIVAFTMLSCKKQAEDRQDLGRSDDTIKLGVKEVFFEKTGGTMDLQTASDAWRVQSLLRNGHPLTKDDNLTIIEDESKRQIGYKCNFCEVMRQGNILHIKVNPKTSDDQVVYDVVLQEGNFFAYLKVIHK